MFELTRARSARAGLRLSLLELVPCAQGERLHYPELVLCMQALVLKSPELVPCGNLMFYHPN